MLRVTIHQRTKSKEKDTKALLLLLGNGTLASSKAEFTLLLILKEVFYVFVNLKDIYMAISSKKKKKKREACICLYCMLLVLAL